MSFSLRWWVVLATVMQAGCSCQGTATALDGGGGGTGAAGGASGGGSEGGSGGSAGGSAGGGTGGGIGPVTPGGPVLFFSDLANAPRTGNSDTSHGQTANVDGAYLTVWGKNLGATQGTSTATVGGVAARVFSWGPAAGPAADLSVRMGLQRVELQVPGSAPLGSAPLVLTVGGVVSNALPFVTRDVGHLYFVGPSGSDANPGTFSAPFATYDKVDSVIANGDVVYFLDGFLDDTAQSGAPGLVDKSDDGTAALPRALVAYPGARATIGGDACEPSGHALLNNWSPAQNRGATHWVMAKMRVESPPNCEQDTAVSLGDGDRLVGNFISNPRTSEGCQSGSVQCGGLDSCGSDLFVLGNELAYGQAVNADGGTGSKQCHGFYISGNRTFDAVETNRELGWNYIHDNGTNRAINIYNESFNGAAAARALISGHRVHDNWIENQRGIGILMGQDVVGENSVYNNLLVNVGLGPLYTDTGGFYAMQLQPGSSYRPTAGTLHVHNNLVDGASYPGALAIDSSLTYAIGLYAVAIDATTQVGLDFANNLTVSTTPGAPFLADYSVGFAGTHDLWFDGGVAPAGETLGLVANPLFVDEAARDFHLAVGSPARDAGLTVSDAVLDFDGQPRPAGAFSIGPYQ